MKNIEKIDEYLIENKIKPSFQRIKIFDYLIKNRNHPTVDIIHKGLINEIPTLSKTTVYNTLKLFSKKGIILIINIEDNESRFDAKISNHGHFKCIKCGKIYDFELDKDKLDFPNLKNFSIEEQHIYLKGICPNCKE
ncbi:MAG: Fur family transcriptional regulator [Bacteroidota bacterium]|nr:Fur family transcriptional regulator [Bacteroidota bacterium]